MRNPTELSQRCSAKRKRGTTCGNWAIQGGTVCRFHGGGAPQVKKKAQERLLALVNPALVVLKKKLEQAQANAESLDSDAVKVAFGVLDRTGNGPTSKVEASGPDGKPIQIETPNAPTDEARLAAVVCICEFLHPEPGPPAGKA